MNARDDDRATWGRWHSTAPRRARRARIGERIAFALIVLAVYAFIACAAFRFRHPWLTETDLLQHLPDALTFGTVERPIR